MAKVAKANVEVEAKLAETNEEPSKSSRIRDLIAEGSTVAEAANVVGVRYQVAYQVAKKANLTLTPSNRARVEVNLDGENISRAEAIRRLSQKGLSKGTIAKQLGTSFQVVYQVLKREEDKLTDEANLASDPIEA